MPLNKSALKRERQDKERNLRNRILKSRVRTAFVQVINAIHDKDQELANEKFKIYMSVVDKAVKKGIFHRNKGARLKSNMSINIKKAFGVSSAAVKKESGNDKPVEDTQQEENQDS